MMTVDGIRGSEKQTNSPALKISFPCNFVNHLELKQDSECQIHFQISKFCKLSFDRSFLGRTWRVWWNCLSVIGLMPKLPPSSILRGPSDCPNAALWPGSHPSPVPPSSTWFPTKVDDPRFILPDLWRRLQEHIVLGMMGLHQVSTFFAFSKVAWGHQGLPWQCVGLSPPRPENRSNRWIQILQRTHFWERASHVGTINIIRESQKTTLDLGRRSLEVPLAQGDNYRLPGSC